MGTANLVQGNSCRFAGILARESEEDAMPDKVKNRKFKFIVEVEGEDCCTTKELAAHINKDIKYMRYCFVVLCGDFVAGTAKNWKKQRPYQHNALFYIKKVSPCK
jgi:hypothetical protein